MKQECLDFLIHSQNPDGGWGYFLGKVSAVEPSAYALLASHVNPALGAASGRVIAFIKNRQTPEGGWPINAVDTEAAAWVSPLAAFALLAVEGSDEICIRAARFVLRSFGTMPRSWTARMAEWLGYGNGANVDTSLGGWGWNPGTAKWVEPTCCSLIFLKGLRAKMRHHGCELPALTREHGEPLLRTERLTSVIAEAESMVYDRQCASGGWNYGNSRVLGEDLRPYPLTTALALIALQDHKDRAENQRSLVYLNRAIEIEKSALSLCYACLCFDLYSQKWHHLLEKLVELHKNIEFFGSVKASALALLALQAKEGKNIFRQG